MRGQQRRDGVFRLFSILWLLCARMPLALCTDQNSYSSYHKLDGKDEITGWRVLQASQAASEQDLDISINGACRPEILYHCYHLLSDHQRASVNKVKFTGVDVAASDKQTKADVEPAVVAKPTAKESAKPAVARETGATSKTGNVTTSEFPASSSGAQAPEAPADATQVANATASNATVAAASGAGPRNATAAASSAPAASSNSSASAVRRGGVNSTADTVQEHEAGAGASSGNVTLASEATPLATGNTTAATGNIALTVGADMEEDLTGESAVAEIEAAEGDQEEQTDQAGTAAAAGEVSSKSAAVDVDAIAAAADADTDNDIDADVDINAKAALDSADMTGATDNTKPDLDEVTAAVAADTGAASKADSALSTDSVDDDAAGIEAEVTGEAAEEPAQGDEASAAAIDEAAGNAGAADGADDPDVDALLNVADADDDAAVRRHHRRHLMGQDTASAVSASSGAREFHKHEEHAVRQQQEALSAVLGRFGLNPSMPAAVVAAANAPIARCLRNTMWEALHSISPDAPQVSDQCKAEVRGFFVARAADASRDLPLLAACATDIDGVCANVTEPGKVLPCLKHAKPQLQPVCRSAVTMRQVDASEDISLDPALNAACAMDRDRLCADAGWGDGAAQDCLEQHLAARSSTSNAAAGGTAKGAGSSNSSSGGKAATAHLGLSPPCATALFQRQMEESEDVRFNYRLASACAGDKHMFCRDVRPGQGDVVQCLERHKGERGFTDMCGEALERNALLRARDVRLDAHFRSVCTGDVRALCFEEEYQVLTSPDAAPGEGSRVLECARRNLPRLRNPACSAHVTRLMADAYADSRLDAHLMAVCSEDVEERCMDPAGGLACLKDAMAKHQRLTPECGEAVNERMRQAAARLEFNPQLAAACAVEVHAHCSAAHLQGGAVMDCLADNRHKSDFGAPCREALVSHLASAVSDVRMLHTLKQDCAADISKLCKTVEPGEGRVLECLQRRRADITDGGCKRQMLRLLGLMVEDYRLDFTTAQACKADVQQYCAGVKAEGGAMHECLRKSWDHLSPACKEAEEKVEKMLHEDVRLNPKIQTHCPLAISTFCGDVQPGSANVLTCLQGNMGKPHFPAECKAVITDLLDRSSVKYSLNAKLKDACDADVATMCKGASDEPTSAFDSGILGCMASNSSGLSSPCRAELAAVVRLQMMRYRMGMPLTSPCDGDVLARCGIDKVQAPLLERGYIQGCLTKHVQDLHKPCWALLSMFDESQYQAAGTLEAKLWAPEQETIAKWAEKVVAEVRGALEPKLINNVHNKVDAALEEHRKSIRPLVSAMVNASTVMLAVLLVLAVLAWYGWRNMGRIFGGSKSSPRTLTIVRKDGSV